MVQSTLLAVALACRIDQCQVARMARRRAFGVARGNESLLDGNGDFLGEADADEASGRQSVAIADEFHCVGWRDDLAFLVALEKREGRMVHYGSLGAAVGRLSPEVGRRRLQPLARHNNAASPRFQASAFCRVSFAK